MRHCRVGLPLGSQLLLLLLHPGPFARQQFLTHVHVIQPLLVQPVHVRPFRSVFERELIDLERALCQNLLLLFEVPLRSH